jgi:hypothetical protein
MGVDPPPRPPLLQIPGCTTSMPVLPDGQGGGQRGHMDNLSG